MSSPPPRQDDQKRRLRERIRTRIAHGIFLLRRPMTFGVRAVVLDGGGRVLLVRHGYVSGWHFPGGGVEPGETCEQALKRELMEETRVAIEGPARLHGLFFNGRISRRDHVAVYVVDRFRVTGEKAPDREIEEARFFPLAALPDGITRGTRERIAEICQGSERRTWW